MELDQESLACGQTSRVANVEISALINLGYDALALGQFAQARAYFEPTFHVNSPPVWGIMPPRGRPCGVPSPSPSSCRVLPYSIRLPMPSGNGMKPQGRSRRPRHSIEWPKPPSRAWPLQWRMTSCVQLCSNQRWCKPSPTGQHAWA